MLYSNSNTFQKRFVTGRLTLTMLLVSAALLWLIGVSGRVITESVPHSFLSFSLPLWLDGVLSFGVYMATAFILNSFVIIEGRTPWLGGLFMWLIACFVVLQCNLAMALSVFITVLLLALLMACYPRGNVQKWVYSAFSILSLAALFMPQYIYILPLFLIYISMSGALSFRNVLAALLGIATPLWFLYGSMIVLPEAVVFGEAFLTQLDGLLHFSFAVPSLPLLLPMAIEAVVLLSATVLFAGSPSPAKPLMRRMLLFVICANIYLWLLSWFVYEHAELLSAWRLPGFTIIVAYIFTLKFNKLFNIVFWIFNIMWIAVAALFGVWIWIF